MRLTVIGAGPGGYETAVAAAKKGMDVTIVSMGPLGGTCLNEGCIPTKCLCRSAEVVSTLREAEAFGATDVSFGFDLAAAMARKDEVVGNLRSGVEFLLKNPHITLLYGKASIAGPNAVRVELAEGGETVVESDYIIIATGSESAFLPITGADKCITSREMLSLTSIPSSLAIIGGGVIGLEFASIFAAFGTTVTVVEYCKNILPRFEEDLSKRLKQSLSKKGISIITSAEVTAVSDDGRKVSFLQKGKPSEVEADMVLMAVGRRPRLETLNLEEAGIAFTRRGVTVNGYMQTSVPSIYAIGDVTGGMMLAHAATFQGLRALNHILAGQPAEGPVDGIRLDVVPAAVFTSPEAAMVGLTEAECEAKGIAVKCLKSFFRANGKALSLGEPDGFCKLIVAEEDEKILGCHLFGAHAADIVQEATVLIHRGATLPEFREVIHAHPTLGEVLQEAARL